MQRDLVPLRQVKKVELTFAVCHGRAAPLPSAYRPVSAVLLNSPVNGVIAARPIRVDPHESAVAGVDWFVKVN